MRSYRTFNLLLVTLVAFWLPMGPCCAWATAGMETQDSALDLHDPVHAATPAHAPTPGCPVSCKDTGSQRDPAPPAPAPCHGDSGEHERCDCPGMLTPACGRVEPRAVTPSISLPLSLWNAPLIGMLPELDVPLGRRAVEPGLPEPLATPSLFQLGCLLTN